MEKNNKKLVFTIFYGVMFALTVIGVFQLLYNAVTMIIYNAIGSYYETLQLPFAIIALLTSIFAIAFVTFEIISICAKKEGDKKKYFIINMVFMSLIVVAMIVCKVIFMKNTYPDEAKDFPHSVYKSLSEFFVIYQGTMTLLITQFTYEVVICALRIAQRVCAKKNKLVETNADDNTIKE